jgi:hypothetical protein
LPSPCYVSAQHELSKAPSASQLHDELRDILTLMVTAGADIHAINEEGATVSEVAYAEGHSRIWTEVLETCGYDMDKVLQGYDADHAWTSALDTPCNKPPAEWPSKLSFAAYLEQREERRKASCRVTEIVDDETAEDDWVREEIKRIFGGHEEGDSGSESDSQSETYGDQSNPEEVDNDMLMEAG